MSNRKRQAKMRVWRAYQQHCDGLVAGQPHTAGVLHPMRTTPGFFRAEGWDTDNPRTDLRHGA
jgi:hypothetical protein